MKASLSGFFQKHLMAIGYLLLAAACLVLYLGFRSDRERIAKQAMLGAQTHAAVCEFKADLHHRIEQSQQFLLDHPTGAFGVTVKVIQASIVNEQKTFDALSKLKCPR